MSSPAWDEKGWGRIVACVIASPAFFLTAGFLLCVCVCAWKMTNKPAVLSRRWCGPAAWGCSVLHRLPPRQRNVLYFWSCSPGWHACIHPGWGGFFDCSLFQGWAWLQGVCWGFSLLLHYGGVCVVLLSDGISVVVLGRAFPWGEMLFECSPGELGAAVV